MKKLSLIMMVVLLFSSQIVMNASEGNSVTATGSQTSTRYQVQERVQDKLQEKFQNKYDEFFQSMLQRQETRFEEFSSKWNKLQEKRNTFNENYMKLVEQYAPDMVDAYTAAFAQHDSIHADLLKTKEAIYTAFSAQTTALVTALKEDISEQLASGEITLAQARTMVKDLMLERKAAMSTLMESYKTAIADEKAQQEVRIQEVNALREQLKTALEANDTETVTSIIHSLYTYLEEHIAFDQFRLTTLKSVFNL